MRRLATALALLALLVVAVDGRRARQTSDSPEAVLGSNLAGRWVGPLREREGGREGGRERERKRERDTHIPAALSGLPWPFLGARCCAGDADSLKRHGQEAACVTGAQRSLRAHCRIDTGRAFGRSAAG
jgi:hypothetical protein